MGAAQAAGGESGSEFWGFSLAFYGDPEVAEACLRLQDEAGADVNVILLLLWQAGRKRSLAAAEIKAIEEAIAPWRQEAVVPLRGVRRWLKHHAGPVDRSGAEELRRQVKRIELEAERLQQQAMAELAAGIVRGVPARSPRSAAQHSFTAYEAVRGRMLPQDVLQALLHKLTAYSSARSEPTAGRDGNAA
jgi:uncharacterized protein (TIGR02444 family)